MERIERQITLYVPIEKADAEMRRISYGVVLEPDTEDLQGDILEPEDIELAAHTYMEDSQSAGEMHLQMVDGAKVVESFLAPSDFSVQKTDGDLEIVRKGSWVMAIRWPEPIWKRIVDGELTGFSVGGSGVRLEIVEKNEPIEVEVISFGEIIVDAFENVAKAGGWMPGPNANYQRLGGNPGKAGGGTGASGGSPVGTQSAGTKIRKPRAKEDPNRPTWMMGAREDLAAMIRRSRRGGPGDPTPEDLVLADKYMNIMDKERTSKWTYRKDGVGYDFQLFTAQHVTHTENADHLNQAPAPIDAHVKSTTELAQGIHERRTALLRGKAKKK